MDDRFVVGRVVSLENGRPIIEVPPGPRLPNQRRITALIEAARAYKRNPSHALAEIVLTRAAEID